MFSLRWPKHQDAFDRADSKLLDRAHEHPASPRATSGPRSYTQTPTRRPSLSLAKVAGGGGGGRLSSPVGRSKFARLLTPLLGMRYFDRQIVHEPLPSSPLVSHPPAPPYPRQALSPYSGPYLHTHDTFDPRSRSDSCLPLQPAPLTLQVDRLPPPSRPLPTPVKASPTSPSALLRRLKGVNKPSQPKPDPPVLRTQRILAHPDSLVAGMDVCAEAGAVASARRKRPGTPSRPGTAGSIVSGPVGSMRPGTAGSIRPSTAGSIRPGTAGSIRPSTAGSIRPGTAGSMKSTPSSAWGPPPSPRPLDEDLEASFTPPGLSPPPRRTGGIAKQTSLSEMTARFHLQEGTVSTRSLR